MTTKDKTDEAWLFHQITRAYPQTALTDPRLDRIFKLFCGNEPSKDEQLFHELVDGLADRQEALTVFINATPPSRVMEAMLYCLARDLSQTAKERDRVDLIRRTLGRTWPEDSIGRDLAMVFPNLGFTLP